MEVICLFCLSISENRNVFVYSDSYQVQAAGVLSVIYKETWWQQLFEETLHLVLIFPGLHTNQCSMALFVIKSCFHSSKPIRVFSTSSHTGVWTTEHSFIPFRVIAPIIIAYSYFTIIGCNFVNFWFNHLLPSELTKVMHLYWSFILTRSYSCCRSVRRISCSGSTESHCIESWWPWMPMEYCVLIMFNKLRDMEH